MILERAYTVSELDKLRNAINSKLTQGYYDPFWGTVGLLCSYSYNHNTIDKVVEERCRTHMIAGHIAEDLIENEKKKL